MVKVKFIKDFATKKTEEVCELDSMLASSLVQKGVAEYVDKKPLAVKKTVKVEEETKETVKEAVKPIEEKEEKTEDQPKKKGWFSK